MSTIAENIRTIRETMAEAARQAGRDPSEIRLCAATKMNDAAAVRAAIEAGVDCCGENRVQEIQEKRPQGAYEGKPLHFIGHLQTNKVKYIVGVVDLIESVDRLELLQCIEKQAAKVGVTQDILLEVNIGNEESKSGFTPDGARQIAAEMAKNCRDRKTVVFLPLIKTSQKFCTILNEHGFRAAEVNGGSEDRARILAAFDRGDYNVLCNSMLLTEGWDCPTVDCIVVLRPTKIRSLYAQMVGRGTRLAAGKAELLLLDFLWHTERHELCHPAHLICENEDVARRMTANIEAAGCPVDIEEAEQKASEDVIAEREEALAKQLQELGEHTAYEQIMLAVSDFEKGNLRLSTVLTSMNG